MALNVTTAVFRPGFNIATASPSLVQWDQGQTLQFEGVELPSAYQVEFTNAVTVQAITMIGNENGVEIPNELLQQSFPITAYIVLHETAEDRETEYWATIYVKARQKPREETPDPEQSSVIDQTIAALQEGVAEAQAASQAVQNMGVEAETLPEGSEATVEKTVDPETGEVTLEFGIPEGRHGATGATPDIQIGTVTTGAPGSQADASITGTREEPRLNLTIPQGPQGDAGVTSVNGKTGAVTLNATDVGAKPASYEAPVSSINGKTGAVVLDASDVGAKPASYEAPVSSVNGKTGAVVLSASDVGAKPASYEAPVSSVNEKTGAVVLDSEDIRYDSTETYSDGTVGKELGTINSALSSLSSVTEIIDTASGAIASFPDGSGLPMRSLVAEIEPVQDLHGYANPWPAGGGQNILDPNLKFTAGTYYGGLVLTTTDGYNFTLSGTPTETGNIVTNTIPTADCIVYPAGTYTSTGAIFSTYKPDGSWYTNRQIGTWTADADFIVRSAYIQAVAGSTPASGSRFISLAKGSTAPTAWSPYANICPISGWTGLEGQRTGKNLLPAKFYSGIGYNGAVGTHYVLTELDDVTQNGNTFSRTVSSWNGFGMVSERLPQGTYKCNIAFSCASPRTSLYVLDSDMTITRRIGNLSANDTWKSTITIAEGEAFIAVVILSSDAGTVSVTEPQIELGSTASPYEEYTGEPISVTFPTTVYGGTDEVIGGNGTSTMGMVDLGDLTWYQNSGAFYALPPNALKNFNGLCSNYAHSLAESVTQQEDKTWQSMSGAGLAIWIIDSAYTTATEFKTAMSGVQLCYELATPTTFTHTGQSVDTLVGQNNVFVDTGDVEVTYQASIKGYIDKVLAS